MQTGSNNRIIHQYQMNFHFSPESIFPLLCPVREYDWIPHWKCKIVYSNSGYAELGCVFQTYLDDYHGTETWVVSHYEKSKKIAFIRTGQRRTTRYEILLKRNASITSLFWNQEITRLDESGTNLISQNTSENFETMMQSLEQLLTDYLKANAVPIVPEF